MSLVIALPTADGLVVAADSRSTLPNGQYIDTAFKIIEPGLPLRTVLSVTGTAVGVAPPAAPCDDLREYLKNAPRIFDLSEDAKVWLGRQSSETLTESATRALSDFCCSRVLTQGWIINRFLGKEVCVVFIGSYLPSVKASLLASFKISISETATPFVSFFSWEEIGQDEKRVALPYGASDYLYKHVLPQGPGLLKSFQGFRERGDRSIRDISAIEATEYATDVINAVSKRMEELPHEYLVGGPVDIVLLGQEERPVRVKWKSP